MRYTLGLYAGDAYASQLNLAISNVAAVLWSAAAQQAAYQPVIAGTAAKVTGGLCAAYVSVETNAVRVTYDGSTPTATNGHPQVAGSAFWVYGANNVKQMQMISTGVAAAAVQVTYYRELT